MRTLLLLLVLAAPAGRAQAPARTGLVLSATPQVVGTTYVLGDSLFVEQGPGVGVRVGYAFRPEVEAYVAVGTARILTDDPAIGTVALTTVDVGVRLDGSPESRGFYTRLAATFQSASAEAPGAAAGTGPTERLRARGGGLTLGFGYELPVGARVALDLGADVTFGRFGALTAGGADGAGCLCARTSRLGLGIVVRL